MQWVLVALMMVNAPGVWARGIETLPAWAVGPAQAAEHAPPPAEADAWVLLQRTEFTYAGDGEFLEHQFRLVRVITERGKAEATFWVGGLGGKASKIKKLLGWNLKPDGEMVRLDSDNVYTLQGNAEASFSTVTTTSATLTGVVQGSLVAFESVQRVKMPMGPAEVLLPMESHPVWRWEVAFLPGGGWFGQGKEAAIRIDTRQFTPWIARAAITPQSVLIQEVPPVPRDEPMHPAPFNALPFVSITFLDPKARVPDLLDSWDGYAKWVDQTYQPRFLPIRPDKAPELGQRGGLVSVLDWMGQALVYKQVYLTPERGWIPEPSDEVLRRGYGDCKDLTACLSGAAAALGFEAHPALARIGEGRLQADLPVNPYFFNHVITAIRLKESLGLPAEVETAKGRFLLVDPTASFTPLGLLPASHRLGRVLICCREGGQWVDIPDRAIEAEALEVVVQGKLAESGGLEGEIRITERGNSAGLRQTARFERAEAMKERLIRLLGLQAWDELTSISLGQPEAKEVPFAVRIKVRMPRFMSHSQGEVVLDQVGFPRLPPLLPRASEARRYPVEALGRLTWRLNLELDLPLDLRPVCSGRTVETPFRKADWVGKVEGRHLSGEFTQVWRDASFGAGKQDEGVQAARKARAQLKNLLEDALSFQPL